MAPPLTTRIEAFIRAHDLVPPGGSVTCLVSGGADSTCLWHALGRSATTSRPSTSITASGAPTADADAEHCASRAGRRVIHVAPAATEAAMRDLRYAVDRGLGLRATGHTASDQVETVLYRIVSSGSTRGIKVRREDGVVRPLLGVTREETAAYCAEHGLAVSRGRDEPGHDARADPRGDPAAARGGSIRAPRRTCSRSAMSVRACRAALEASLVELLASRAGTPVGRSRRRRPRRARVRHAAARGHGRVGAVDARGRAGRSRGAHAPAGDRLAGRRKKVQDLLVDAKVPRAERETWPIVVHGDEVVAVPGHRRGARLGRRRSPRGRSS